MNEIHKNKPYNRQILFYHLYFLIASITLAAFPARHAGAEEIRQITVKHIMDMAGDFNQPTEVAVSDNGHIFVLDGANGRVAVFNEKGKWLYQFGKPGAQDGELRSPVGFDLDHDQRVYIADSGNQRIQIFNEQGKYIRKIDLSSWNARPVEVKVAEKTGLIYICDARNHQILCFDINGVFKFAWGRYGEALGEFKFPGEAVINGKGDLFVIDILNGRIQRFTPGVKNPHQLSTLGVLPGQLFRPKGLAIDPQSRIFVSDSYTGVIQVFDQNGNLYGILSRGPSEFLRLKTPIGMAFDKNGRFYVVQATLNIISVFQIFDKR